jgi:hypothetical protein
MFKRLSILIFLILISFSFARANAGSVLINEIAWMGTDISSTDEWIELFNSTDADIDLSGWSLKSRDGQPDIVLEGIIPAYGYFLLERTDDNTVTQKVANQIYVGSLGNTGEYLELIDDGNNLVDFVDMSTTWEYGDNDTKQTMERADENSWQTSQVVSGSPGGENIIQNFIIEDVEENGVTSVEDIQEISTDVYEIAYKYSDILINEIVSDPADGDTEWIEIFNNTTQSIDLEDWYIKEGSGAKTSLDGIINSQGYYVVGSPSGNLNNSGDEILLFSPNNKLINDVVYGEWNDGDISDNAPVATDPYSVARISNRDTLNNSNDFGLTIKLTKGSANIILDEEEFSLDEIDDYDFGQTVVVSEIFPNPEGDEKKQEFVELYNYGARDINLFGWQIGDASKNRFEFERGDFIKAKAYLVLYRSDTNIALNNTGDALNIYQPGNEEARYSLTYMKSEEGFSFNNTKTEETENFYNKEFAERDWTWSETPSPGEKNKFRLINHAPEVDFSFSDELFVGVPVLFDSSDTFDEDGDELTFHWDFGDGFENILVNPEHTFFEGGVFNIILEVNDGENISLKEKTATIVNRLMVGDNAELKKDELNFGKTKIFISEILPNPDGDDLEGEFVEIYNASDFPVNLTDWMLDDMEGGSKPYKLKDDNNIIEAGNYFIINRTESGVILNNSYDQVRLIDSNNNLVDEVEYRSTFNGKSYVKNENGDWVWADLASPGGKANISSYENETILMDNVVVSEYSDYFSLKTPREVQEHGAGQKVLVEGVVNSLPGMFGTQYFYIDGDGGVQIYSNSKDFPELTIGDLIQVRGEISKINQESRVKTKLRDEIVVIDTDYTLTPIELTCDLGKEHLGKLVFVLGEIIEKDGNKFVLDNSNWKYNFEIKDGTSIDKKNLGEGDAIKIFGVVTSNKDGYIILPRMENDIEHIEEYGVSDTGEVLGEFSEVNEWELGQKYSRKNDYIFLVLLFVALASLILIYKRKPRI